MDADTKKLAKPRRRWFRLSLRTLLIVITVSSVPLGWVGWRLGEVRREQEAVAWVEELGGEVGFFYRYETDDRSWWEKSTDKWFGGRTRWVNLGNTQVSDLSPLAELKNLEVLGFQYTQVSDLSPLTEFNSLKNLSLYNTQVSDLSPLAELRNLELLGFANTQVKDLSPLANLKNLEVLGLVNTQVRDLSPLANLKSLQNALAQ